MKILSHPEHHIFLRNESQWGHGGSVDGYGISVTRRAPTIAGSLRRRFKHQIFDGRARTISEEMEACAGGTK